MDFLGVVPFDVQKPEGRSNLYATCTVVPRTQTLVDGQFIICCFVGVGINYSIRW